VRAAKTVAGVEWNMSGPSSDAVKTTREWLLNEWAESTSRSLQSMADERPSVTWQAEELRGDPTPEGTGLRLEIPLSLFPVPHLWISLPPETVQELGSRTLRAAGIEDADSDEVKNTCMEVMQQTSSGMGQAISGRLKERVSSQLHEVASIPEGTPAFGFDVEFAGATPRRGYLLVSIELLAALEEKTAPEVPEHQESRFAEERKTESSFASHSGSKTFDLLLEVSMPVSVSFGRTEMLIKEVLKLTTGSIVELSRSVSEPVDIIVNDCIIARGEVVVVEGNYGVRIQQIASRQDRLRSSGQPLASIGKPEAIAGLLHD
jgi:flagellar motor switch protein FliN/FliY